MSEMISIVGYPSSSVIGSCLGGLFSTIAMNPSSLVGLVPVAGILSSAVLGAAFLASAVHVAKKLWDSHNFKAVGFLDQILKLLTEFISINNTFIKHLDTAHSSIVHLQFIADGVKLCLFSETQRIVNGNICDNADEIFKTLLFSLKQISFFEDTHLFSLIEKK